jgi:hypothetical protein
MEKCTFVIETIIIKKNYDQINNSIFEHGEYSVETSKFLEVNLDETDAFSLEILKKLAVSISKSTKERVQIKKIGEKTVIFETTPSASELIFSLEEK